MANTHSLDLEASSSQYASISDASQTGLAITGDLTIEAWVKTESDVPNGSSYQIVSKYNTSSQKAYEFNINDPSAGNDTIRLLVSNNGTDDDIMSVEYTFTAGIWYHVAVSWDASASTAAFYVNGLSIGTDTGTATSIYNSTSDFMVGARPNASPTNFFDGLIDDVRVWNDIRTASEIQDNLGVELVGNEANLQGYWKLNNDYTDETSNGNDLTASGSPVFSTDIPWEGSLVNIVDDGTLATNLVSYWKLDETSGTRVDAHGSNDLTDNNTVGSGTGIIGNGADFEASNSEYLSITDGSQTGLDITSDFTFALWVKLESQPGTDDNVVILDKYTGAGDERGYSFRYADTGGTKQIRLSLSSDGTAGTLTTTEVAYTLSNGTWYHLAISYDASGGKADVYVDGVNVGTMTGQETSIYNNTARFTVGATSTTTKEFDGIMDEVGVWSRALTAGEVSNLYNEGNALSYDATAISFSVSDTVTLTESSTNLRERNFSVSETATLTESVTAALGKIFNITETVSLSEALTTAKTHVFNIVESVSLTEIKAQLRKLWATKTKNSSTWADKPKSSSSWTDKSRS